LRRIKREVERNQRLRDDFGLIPDKTSGWDTEKLFFVRDKPGTQFEPNMFCYGIASGGTGMHMDYMYWDDVITTENSMSETLRNRIMENVTTSIYPQVKPGGQLLCVGTPKHVDDLYSTFADFRGEASKSPAWRCYFYPAYRDTAGKTLWPDRYNHASLNMKRESLIAEWGVQGERMFTQEYLLQPHALGGDLFKESWLQYYDPEDPGIQLDKYPHYIGIDPATGEKDQAAYSATIVLCHASRSDRYYIREIIRERVGLADLPNHVTSIYAKWRQITPHLVIGMESGFHQTGLIKWINKAIPLQPFDYKEWASPHGKALDKFQRIELMGSFFAARKVLLPEPTSYPMTATFVNKEYLPFPQCSTYDMLDALNGALHMVPQSAYQPPILRWD